MIIPLDRSAPTPIYRQIADGIRAAVQQGQIPLGSALPPVRALGKELGVALVTAFRAYEELRITGLVNASPRQGTRIVDVLPAHHALPTLSLLPSRGPVSGFELVGRSARVKSLASAVPDPELFLADELISEIEALRRESPWNFYYCDPAGAPELVEQIRLVLASEGMICSSSEILVTSGGTHALSLLLGSLCVPGDSILIQEPGPLGLRELLRIMGLSGVAVRLRGNGVDLKHAVRLVEECRPKVMAVSPDFGHSTGLQMSLSERNELVEFAQHTRLKLIDDRSMAPLNLDGKIVPTLATLDPSIVSTIGSFSYALAPGLRIGFLVAPQEVRSVAMDRFKAQGISGIGFLQTALARYIARGAYRSHLQRVVPKYRARRDALIESLASWMPVGVSWTIPVGGLSAWLTLNSNSDSEKIYKMALRREIAFAPGSLFFSSAEGRSHLRLSYGLLEPRAIPEAVRLLAELIP